MPRLAVAIFPIRPEARVKFFLTANENSSQSPMIICSCANVSDKKIHEALAGGARTLADLQQSLGVSMKCGRCKESVLGEISAFYGSGPGPQGSGIPQHLLPQGL